MYKLNFRFFICNRIDVVLARLQWTEDSNSNSSAFTCLHPFAPWMMAAPYILVIDVMPARKRSLLKRINERVITVKSVRNGVKNVLTAANQWHRGRKYLRQEHLPSSK